MLITSWSQDKNVRSGYVVARSHFAGVRYGYCEISSTLPGPLYRILGQSDTKSVRWALGLRLVRLCLMSASLSRKAGEKTWRGFE